MGREIRKVPHDWQHPRDGKDNPIPQFDKTWIRGIWEHLRYDTAWYFKHPKHIREWFEGFPSLSSRPYYRRAFFRPTHYQVYETVSEGTPTSPVFSSKEKIVDWLISKGHSRDAAENFVKAEWAPSFVMLRRATGEVETASGVDAMADLINSNTAEDKAPETTEDEPRKWWMIARKG